MNPEVKLKEIAELERRIERLEKAVLMLAAAVLTMPAAPRFWHVSPFEPETTWESAFGRTAGKDGGEDDD